MQPQPAVRLPLRVPLPGDLGVAAMEEERAGEQMRPLLTTVTRGWGAVGGSTKGRRGAAAPAWSRPAPLLSGGGHTRQGAAGDPPLAAQPPAAAGRGNRAAGTSAPPGSPAPLSAGRERAGVPACRPRVRGRAPSFPPAAGGRRGRSLCSAAGSGRRRGVRWAAAAAPSPPSFVRFPAGLVPAAVGGAAAPGLAVLPVPFADEFLGEGEVRTHGKQRASPCPHVARPRSRVR